MKPNRYIILFLFFVLGLLPSLRAQEEEKTDSTGLPGDHFSLEGALALFKKASSPEEFERMLNTENNHVNNLDLNDDGEIDYIKVIDRTQGDLHAFVLQIPVSASENQDIAVIELEKNGDKSAILQIVGDEEIFGEQTIVEPENSDDEAYMNTEEDLHAGPFSKLDANIGFNATTVVVNVWIWPCVRFVYTPGYRIWASPWRWHAYPGWWHPWRPWGWYAFRPYRHGFYHGFAVVQTHRVIRAHNVYAPVRVSSFTVRTRNAAAMGHYKVTHTRTTVTGPRGNKTVRKTTTVQGRGGRVKASRTTVHRRRG